MCGTVFFAVPVLASSRAYCVDYGTTRSKLYGVYFVGYGSSRCRRWREFIGNKFSAFCGRTSCYSAEMVSGVQLDVRSGTQALMQNTELLRVVD